MTFYDPFSFQDSRVKISIRIFLTMLKKEEQKLNTHYEIFAVRETT
jgi:hypothetical protein